MRRTPRLTLVRLFVVATLVVAAAGGATFLHPTLSDITLTHADGLGFGASGMARLAPTGRWQVSVFRASSDPGSEIVTRRISQQQDGAFFAEVRRRPRGGGLVRLLFESNREPELGGEIMEISIMFTDIEGFTSLAERLSPDALARALGAYLEAMARGVGSTGGTIDKFIGDAVMAFWNAPVPLPDHARAACRAALACMQETARLYASDAWAGLPPLFTRFGLHTARVMVGHFGAPERLA